MRGVDIGIFLDIDLVIQIFLLEKVKSFIVHRSVA